MLHLRPKCYSFDLQQAARRRGRATGLHHARDGRGHDSDGVAAAASGWRSACNHNVKVSWWGKGVQEEGGEKGGEGGGHVPEPVFSVQFDLMMM